MSLLLGDYGSDSDDEQERDNDKGHSAASRLPVQTRVEPSGKRPVKILLDLPKDEEVEETILQDGHSDGPRKKGRFALTTEHGQSSKLGWLPAPKNRVVLPKPTTNVDPTQAANITASDLPTNRRLLDTDVGGVAAEKKNLKIEERPLREASPPFQALPETQASQPFFNVVNGPGKEVLKAGRSMCSAPATQQAERKEMEVEAPLTTEEYNYYLQHGYYYDGHQWIYDPAAAQRVLQQGSVPGENVALMPEVSAEQTMNAAQGRELPKAIAFDEENKEAEEDEETRLERERARPMGGARRKNQLSSLLFDARSNRAKLEETIAKNKQSARAARAKYGF